MKETTAVQVFIGLLSENRPIISKEKLKPDSVASKSTLTVERVIEGGVLKTIIQHQDIKGLIESQIHYSITGIEAQEYTADGGAIELNSDSMWLSLKQAVDKIYVATGGESQL